MSDPDAIELHRLRAELAYVTAPQRLGFMLAGLGLAMAILRGTAVPGLPRVVPAALILTALGLLAIGTIRRVRWHRRRRRRPSAHHRHAGLDPASRPTNDVAYDSGSRVKPGMTD